MPHIMNFAQHLASAPEHQHVSVGTTTTAAAKKLLKSTSAAAGKCSLPYFDFASEIYNSDTYFINIFQQLQCDVALFSKPFFDINGLVKVEIEVELQPCVASMTHEGDDNPTISTTFDISSSSSSSSSNSSNDNSNSNGNHILLYPEPLSGSRIAMINASDFCSLSSIKAVAKNESNVIQEDICDDNADSDSERKSFWEVILSRIMSVIGRGNISSDSRNNSQSCKNRTATAPVTYADKHGGGGCAVAYARRGNCPFDVKARVASELGYSAIVVETFDSSIFPAGSQNDSQKSAIPVLMVPGGSFAAYIKNTVLANSSFLQTLLANLSSSSENDYCSSTINHQSAHNSRLATIPLYLPIKLMKSAPIEKEVSPQASSKSSDLSVKAILWPWPFSAAKTSSELVEKLKRAFSGVIILLVVFVASCKGVKSAQTKGVISDPRRAIMNRHRVHAFYAVFISALVLIFLFTRLATLRMKSFDDSSAQSTHLRANTQDNSITRTPVYHHTETDEVIFETLVHNVRSKGLIAGYRLDAATIRYMNLSPDNYSPDIFIHPPTFTIIALFFNHYLDLYVSNLLSIFGLSLSTLQLPRLTIPLPAVSLLFHVGTFIALTAIVILIFSHDDILTILGHDATRLSFSYSFSLLAIIICMTCPLLAFCSSKFWIDNCLLFSCTASVAALLYLIQPSRPVLQPNQPKNMKASSYDTSTSSFVNGSITDSNHLTFGYSEYRLKNHVLAGIFYSIFALNTKITALAILPAMLSWIIFYRACVYYPIVNHIIISKESIKTYRRLFVVDLLYHTSAFISAAVICYLPWTYTYYTATGGRLIPNSWPSKSMIENSPFIQQAINRHWIFYVDKLSSLSPAVFVGLLMALSILFLFLVDMLRISYSYFFILLRVRKDAIRYNNNGSVHGSTYYNYFDHAIVYMLSNKLRLHLAILAIWSIAFIVPFTALGALGAGFQTRFIAPAVPPLSILTCNFVVAPYLNSLAYARSHSEVYLNTGTQNARFFNLTSVLLRFSLVSLLVAYAAGHAFYYSVLYPNLFADLDHSLVDIVVSIIDNAYYEPSERGSSEAILKFMRHFGLNK